MTHQSMTYRLGILMVAIPLMALLSSCHYDTMHEADVLNEKSYAFHYRNIDSTFYYAQKAFEASPNYANGRAEALNNMAFVSIVRMDYDKAYDLLLQVYETTNNQIELLVADIQLMRLCQRESRNKEFYDYREKALQRLARINEERNTLTSHLEHRLAYAESEQAVVTSTYYYYVGLHDQSREALLSIDINDLLERDTAQLLNYYYNIGSGGIVRSDSKEDIAQQEYDNLLHCYLLAQKSDYPYWTANALQAISEHLQNNEERASLLAANKSSVVLLNAEEISDSLLPKKLACVSKDMFDAYGDVYQTAGAYRTIAQCCWEEHDYISAIENLNAALSCNTSIFQAPDLVASIREQLSLAYSAINDKVSSDYNRNIYLDLQEQTRQDRQLEARVEQLSQSSSRLNSMIYAVLAMIVLLIALLLLFDYMRRRNDKRYSVDTLLSPLSEWQAINAQHIAKQQEQMEELSEHIAMEQMQVWNNRKRNLEQRAKVSFVNGIIPFIDRMVHEIRQLTNHHESPEVRQERYSYIVEITDKINDYNEVLTKWIQMRQGDISLHIESFSLQQLFSTLQRSKMSFAMKDIDLQVKPTRDVVKADKTLTLFMLNTMADNARKFTPEGGTVTVSSEEHDNYIEISVADTGQGIPPEQQAHVFDYKPIYDESEQRIEGKTPHSHGFGLMNCKGIIEKYRKMSQRFSMCEIGLESELGKGSRFYFRLPKGALRAIGFIVFMMHSGNMSAQSDYQLYMAKCFADSAYYSNVNESYVSTLQFADSCRHYLNEYYLTEQSNGRQLMEMNSQSAVDPAEITWLRDSLPTDYSVILDMRNEVAVAALALHEWSLYHYNNRVYTQLFRELSADPSLSRYVAVMQKSKTNKTIAITLLFLMLLFIFPAYYFLYYRYRLRYRFMVDRINAINHVLLSSRTPEEKLASVNRLWNRSFSEQTELGKLVDQIKDSLEMSIATERVSSDQFALAEDELKRSIYERDRLYVSNSVLDNCLSTLKHETMYYPSRISHLVEEKDTNLAAVAELADYYKELYSVLAAQAQRQVEGNLRIDAQMIGYLFTLLTRLNGSEKVAYTESDLQGAYVMLTVPMTQLLLTSLQCSQLFSPLTIDVGFLLCKQIVREVGEVYNARRCGIQARLEGAVHGEAGTPIIEIILTQRIWNSSKSSL